MATVSSTDLSSARPRGLPPLARSDRLTAQGMHWLQALPVVQRPLITARRHPHIVNRLAMIWDDPRRVDDYFAALLFGADPGEPRFAVEVVDELMRLQQAQPVLEAVTR
jgi:hypothetical protein